MTPKIEQIKEAMLSEHLDEVVQKIEEKEFLPDRFVSVCLHHCGKLAWPDVELRSHHLWVSWTCAQCGRSVHKYQGKLELP